MLINASSDLSFVPSSIEPYSTSAPMSNPDGSGFFVMIFILPDVELDPYKVP